MKLVLITLASLSLMGCGTERADPRPAAVASDVAAVPVPTAAPTLRTRAPERSAVDPVSAPTAGSAKLAVEAEGLRWFATATGSASPLPFGTAQDLVLASLERERGPAARGTSEECGAGPVGYANWADGLSLKFQKDRFVGWGLDGRAAGALATANGIGPGSARADLDESFGDVRVFPSTLGTEFAAGGIYGTLDGTGPRARITYMWAGVSCVAR